MCLTLQSQSIVVQLLTFMHDLSPEGEELPAETPPALLFTGEGVSFLTDEHRNLLRQIACVFVGGRAVELSVSGDFVSTNASPEQELEPVPATRAEFRAFATEHGYSDMRARKAWNVAVAAGERPEGSSSTLPLVEFLDGFDESVIHVSSDERIIDLRSVYDRFVASRMAPIAWGGDLDYSRPNLSIDFLAHIVNEKVQPEEPIRVRRKD